MDLDQSHPCRVIYGTSSTGSIKYFNKQKETNKIHLLEFKEYFYDLTWETIDEQIKYSEIKVASAKNKVETYRFLDSLYQNFAHSAKRRFELGESNYLEMITAESKQKQLQIQFKNLSFFQIDFFFNFFHSYYFFFLKFFKMGNFFSFLSFFS